MGDPGLGGGVYMSQCWAVLGAWHQVAGMISTTTCSQDGGVFPELGVHVSNSPHPPPPLLTGQTSLAHLIVSVLLQEMAGHVAGQDIPEHVLIVLPQLLHLVDLLLGLNPPEEVQAGSVLQLQFRGEEEGNRWAGSFWPTCGRWGKLRRNLHEQNQPHLGIWGGILPDTGDQRMIPLHRAVYLPFLALWHL